GSRRREVGSSGSAGLSRWANSAATTKTAMIVSDTTGNRCPRNPLRRPVVDTAPATAPRPASAVATQVLCPGAGFPGAIESWGRLRGGRRGPLRRDSAHIADPRVDERVDAIHLAGQHPEE